MIVTLAAHSNQSLDAISPRLFTEITWTLQGFAPKNDS